MPVALRIFLIVVVGATLSGSVAYLGNQLGRYVGRRKMTIAGLRPRYTSNVITVATGALIYLLTLGILSAMSEDVRLLIHGIDELRAQGVALEQQIKATNDKVRAGPALLPFQPLAVGVVQCGLSKDEMREQIETLLQLANDNLVAHNNQLAAKNGLMALPDDTKLVKYVSAEKDGIIDSLRKAPKGSTVVCIILSGKETVYYKDDTVAQFLFRPNPVVLRKGQVITSGVIDGRGTSAQVFKQVYEFIYKDLNYTCLEQYRMVRNPLTNKLDTSIDVYQMRRAADQIARMNKPMRLQVVATSEIHPLGPLEAELLVVGK